MIWPVHETLVLLEPHLPHALISPAAFGYIKNIANRLPNVMTAYFLECRLTENTARVDFQCEILAKNAAPTTFTELDMGANHLEALLVHPLWRRIHDFLVHWAEPTSLLSQQVPLIWWEFDIERAPLEIPYPCLHFCLDPQFVAGNIGVGPIDPGDLEKYQQVTESALGCLLGYPVPTSVRRQLSGCFACLPVGGVITHVSVMLPRQPVALKLDVSVPKDRLLDYVMQIGWPGSSKQLQTILTMFCASCLFHRISLTLGEMISPKIELNLWPLNSPGDPKLQHLCARLVEEGLCSPTQQEALLAWPGSFRAKFRQQAWPTRIAKWLDVKITLHPQSPLEVKGYLGFAPRFSPW